MAAKLRAGIIGLGIGQSHAKGYQKSPDTELVAVCDANEQRLKQYADDWKVDARYTDYLTMFREANLDMVSVCLPNSLHAPVTISALEAGINVLCEKPMAVSLAEAEHMVTTAAKTNRTLMMAYNYRFRADTQWIKRMVSEGNLGKIYHANVEWHRETGIPGWGLFGSKAASGGGALIDLGVHVIDLALWMLGFPKVQTISAQTRSLFGEKGKKTWFLGGARPTVPFDVDDGGVAFMRLDNDVSVFAHISWAEHSEPQQDNFGIQLFGTEGTVVLNVKKYQQEDSLRFYTEIAGEPVTVVPKIRLDGSYGHEGLIIDLAASLRNGSEPSSSGQHGLIGVQVLEGIYRSAEARHEVNLG
jgi:predicted dehydrogenase